MRLDPLYPPLWDFYIGRALLHLGRYEEALVSLDKCAGRATFFGNSRRYAAAALAQLGRLDEARAALPALTSPGSYASIADIRRLDSYVEGIEFSRLIDGLHMAGLPL
jgi:tetratricopeptide (TPR) repeat protein